ncbi:alpha/beta fold hydrolase [Bounagaea algeriensis]
MGAPQRHGVTLAGSRVHYFSYGATHRPDAETVVMVHGLRGTHEGLELLAAELLAAGDRPRRVIIPDLPGYGESSPLRQVRHDVPGYAGMVRALIDHLGERSVVLAGHSFGSVVAACVAEQHPELVHRLVLINAITSPPLRGPRGVLSALTSGYYALGRVLPARLGKAWLGNRYVVLVASRAMTRSKDPELRRFIDDNHLRYFSRFHDPAVLGETYQASISSTVLDHTGALRVPVLLVAGEDDDIAPLDGQRNAAAHIDDARLVVLSNVGHLVHYEAPDRAARAVARFLTAERPREASGLGAS